MSLMQKMSSLFYLEVNYDNWTKMNILDLDEQIAKNMDKFVLEDGRTYAWQCLLCGRNNKDKSIVKHHVETHFPGYAQQCPHCQNMMKTRKSLKMHIIREHSGRKGHLQSQ